MIENWHELVDQLPTFAVRLLVALVCGTLLGLERERREKPAGIRTIVLITVGSALYMIVSSLVPLAMDWPEITRADPSRIAAQVVTGIGFLGAGTIIQARGAIHGLTTAAVIWVAAGIGLCAGLGFPITAFGVTLIVLAALVLMDPLRDTVARRSPRHTITIRIPDDTFVLQRVQFAISEQDFPTTDVSITPEHGELTITFTMHATGRSASTLLDALAVIQGVRGFSYLQ